TPGVARELDFTPWGGAYNRVAADATAFAFRDERFLLKHAAIVPLGAPAAVRASARRWLNDSWTLVRPGGTGHVYPNFPVPELPDPGPAYWGDNHGRVAQVRAAYDPDGFFAAPG
ncbi:MAG: BBE domain-containing protein, partial [Solirubrobacteraceae bacterium]